MTSYVSNIFLDVDGQEIEVVSLNTTTRTGRKLVKTMNRTGRAKGYSKGIAEHSLQITVVLPKNVAQPDWDEMAGAKLTLMDMDGNPLYSYLDCFTTQSGEQYGVDNEARRDLTIQSLRKVQG